MIPHLSSVCRRSGEDRGVWKTRCGASGLEPDREPRAEDCPPRAGSRRSVVRRLWSAVRCQLFIDRCQGDLSLVIRQFAICNFVRCLSPATCPLPPYPFLLSPAYFPCPHLATAHGGCLLLSPFSMYLSLPARRATGGLRPPLAGLLRAHSKEKKPHRSVVPPLPWPVGPGGLDAHAAAVDLVNGESKWLAKSLRRGQFQSL